MNHLLQAKITTPAAGQDYNLPQANIDTPVAGQQWVS
jgi:hypothetical protein